MNYLIEIANRPWVGIYWKFMAFVMLMGGIVHVQNILGFGSKNGEIPRSH